jgi:hypothetical protein
MTLKELKPIYPKRKCQVIYSLRVSSYKPKDNHDSRGINDFPKQALLEVSQRLKTYLLADLRVIAPKPKPPNGTPCYRRTFLSGLGCTPCYRALNVSRCLSFGCSSLALLNLFGFGASQSSVAIAKHGLHHSNHAGRLSPSLTPPVLAHPPSR